MNERVSVKAPDYVTPKSRVADYPLLGFLFQVATVGRLYIVSFGKVNTLMPDPARLNAYHNLMAKEKYVFWMPLQRQSD